MVQLLIRGSLVQAHPEAQKPRFVSAFCVLGDFHQRPTLCAASITARLVLETQIAHSSSEGRAIYLFPGYT